MIVGSSATADNSDDDAPVSGGQAAEPAHERGTHETADASRGLPKDVVFGLLSAKRRRRVLQFMAENGDETTLSDLADHIAALENDTEIRLLDSQQRKRVYVALYQCHLPKMDDADVIDFNHSRGTVERRAEADQLYAYLEIDQMAAYGDDTRTESADADEASGVRETLAKLFS